MTVGELKELLDEYGDHLEVRLTDETLNELAPIERVDSLTRDEHIVVLVAE